MTYAVSRPVKSRARIRAFNDETAHQALTLAGWGKDREAFGFNKGQFSIIDLVLAALRFTGPAEATIATWTAADADLRRTAWHHQRTGAGRCRQYRRADRGLCDRRADCGAFDPAGRAEGRGQARSGYRRPE